MKTIDSISQLRAQIKQARASGKTIALVPTMGNLHAGHLALIERARQAADFIVASIFVNPLQFGVNEDLDSYPRTLAQDQAQLIEAGCHLLFTPNEQLMYPQGMATQSIVRVPVISEGLCGGSRPGHFDGVATIVTKLLNLVQPDVAVFGEKDFQQLAVIRKLTEDLNLPIDIIGAPIVRDHDGLALSSRNGYLSAEQRQQAPRLYHHLQQTVCELKAGGDAAEVIKHTKQRLIESGFRPDYIELRSATDLAKYSNQNQLIVLAAVFLGQTRLIDNIIFNLVD